MADHDQWLIGEITDIVATATELRYRRATGEPIAWHEHVGLQRRMVHVLQAIAECSPHSRDVRRELERAERRMRHLTAPEPGPHAAGRRPDLGATP
jgi:hypothetical protein